MEASCAAPVGETAVGVGLGVRRPPETQTHHKTSYNVPIILYRQ